MDKDKKQKQEIADINNIGRVKEVNIVPEMQEAYLDYAMSVIIARALPDVRDGLKPVHRRILYATWAMGLKASAKFRKSATIVGEVLGKFHPHGDIAVYDSLARMAQDFSLRYPLINGQGNWGCFTKDTKVKLADGRSLSFGELALEAKQGKRNFTYTFNKETKKIEIAEIINPRLTKEDTDLVQVVLDSGEKIRCTPNHRFMLRDGTYKEAQTLQPNDSLMPCYFRLSTKADDANIADYSMLLQPETGEWNWVHHLADEWNIKNGMYAKNSGRIRHHADFNKLNNNPSNIKRLNWKEHWEAHYKYMSKKHKNDPEYVKKLAEGRNRYIESHKDVFAERARKLNKILWADPKFRTKMSERIKEMWRNPEYKKQMSEMSSKNLKKLWKQPKFHELLSNLKSDELKKRWRNKEYATKMREVTRKMSNKLWANEEHREKISKLNKDRWSQELRNKRGELSKKFWQNPGYRANYPKNHFSEMAKILWSNPATRELHSQKAKMQWQDADFRRKISAVISENNKKRIEENPDSMKDLAAKAANSLRNKWQNPEYKLQVVKKKILGYVSGLLNKYGNITSDIYENDRRNNGVPKLQNALGYFGNFNEIIEKAKLYNHKVVSVKKLKKREDVYDLTVNGTHNFLLDVGVFVHNSIDGDAPAAMRYTEAKMSGIAEELLFDIDRETIDFVPNYDGSQKEPKVMPAKLPNLLLNGSMGIAVGMATNIPPHNLTEICDAAMHTIDNPDCTVDDLMQFVQGPDFPTGGIIFDKNEIKAAYATGRGGIVMQAKADIQEEKGKFSIIITEIPYQVNKSTLIEKIADLVTDKKLEGIRDIRDESSKEGIRIVIELKKDAYPKKVLNRLFVLTQLQETFHVNMLALVDGIQPKVLTLKNVLEEYIKHRLVVVRRRAEYDLARAKERAHILDGLKIAISKIDRVIAVIKKSADKDAARVNLMKQFKFTELQAVAILEMRLQQLANLERLRVEQELKEKMALIKELEDLLASKKKMQGKVKDEIKEIKEKYGDERRTKVIAHGIKEFKPEDLVPNEPTIVVITQDGYIKRLPPDTFKSQSRGGKGVMGLATKEEDIVQDLFTTMTHNDLFFFTTRGRVFQLKTYDIPAASRIAKGQALQNFLQLSQNEKVSSVLSFDDLSDEKHLVMVTRNGLIKKTEINAFENVRRSGLIAIGLKEDDHLEWVKPSTGNDDIIIVTSKGQSIRFKEKDVRAMGRGAAGVHAIRLKKGDTVVGMGVVDPKLVAKNMLELFVISENGCGKKTNLKSYKVQRRGGSGIKTMSVTQKTGEIVSAYISNVEDDRDMIIISEHGQVIRTAFKSVPSLGRATQGVRLMRFKDEKDGIASVTFI